MNDERALQHFRDYFRIRFSDNNQAVPFAWQEELFRLFIGGTIPSLIDLPTGTGKTTLMLVWYAALAWQMSEDIPLTVPRRLIWVVNRRVVVDQATDEAEALQKLSGSLDPPLRLAVSTLRGELADNGDWRADPTQPAIVIGTVDMTGSRLLFSGYGDGPSRRAQHAGLLGVDVLFVNDEAHLTPAFSRLLRKIEGMKPAEKIPNKTFRFCALSATHIAGSELDPFPKTLDADLAANPEFERRFTGYKRLLMHREPDSKKVEAKLVSLASESLAPRTIVFTEKPEDALKLFVKLKPVFGEGRIELLTGTMRGFERDALAGSDVFKALREKYPPETPVCLVATSAGEVGVDITAETDGNDRGFYRPSHSEIRAAQSVWERGWRRSPGVYGSEREGNRTRGNREVDKRVARFGWRQGYSGLFSPEESCAERSL